ncbi:hypothetical protein Vretimale_5158, partial [Volvox reticuliferus]
IRVYKLRAIFVAAILAPSSPSRGHAATRKRKHASVGSPATLLTRIFPKLVLFSPTKTSACEAEQLMGSHPPARLELTEGKVLAASAAETAQKFKRHKRGHHEKNSGAGLPSASECDLDAAQPEWWQPQPHATLDPNEYQDRPYSPLATSLSCALCDELLQEAMTSLECGHSYCYDCIERQVDIGGNHNVCPVAGCGVVLGPSPFDHHRLVYDTLLDGLVQKIFPRPDLDAALTTRRAEREEATRQARAAVNGCGGGQRHSNHNNHRQGHQHQQQQQQSSKQQQQLNPDTVATARMSASRDDDDVVVAETPGCRRRRGGSSMDGGAEGDDEDSDQERGVQGTGRGTVAAAGDAGGRGASRRHR